MKSITLSIEDAKTIKEAVDRLASEGLLSISMYDFAIHIMEVYFPKEKAPWWVWETDWWKA